MKCSSLLIRVGVGWGGASCRGEGSQPWLQESGLLPDGGNLSSLGSFQCDCTLRRKMSKLGSREILSLTPYNKTNKTKTSRSILPFTTEKGTSLKGLNVLMGTH